MNLVHRWYCKSDMWARSLQGEVLPRVLADIELGDSVLEIGSGPGVSTDWLRTRVPHLTTIEIDHALAQSLSQRMEGENVTVVEGDATAMTFSDASFSSALCFTMLHHVPSPELQDKLLAETYRVLRPGSTFAGSDSTPSFVWNIFHVFDTRVPVDPEMFPQRLEAAGFTNVSVQVLGSNFSFRARKPN